MPDPVEPTTVEPESAPIETVEPAETVVESEAHSLKRWTFVFALAAVWIPAEAIGVGLYYWWFHSLDKTWPVFVVLVFVAVCTIAALLVAMIDRKPLVSAFAVGLMSAPFAATLAASVLHGIYYCDRVGHCLVGLIPY